MEKGKKTAPGLVSTARLNALFIKRENARGLSITVAHSFLPFLRRDNNRTDNSSKFVRLA